MHIGFAIAAVHEHAGSVAKGVNTKKLDVNVKFNRGHPFRTNSMTVSRILINLLFNACQVIQTCKIGLSVFGTVIYCLVNSTAMPDFDFVTDIHEFWVPNSWKRMLRHVVFLKMAEQPWRQLSFTL